MCTTCIIISLIASRRYIQVDISVIILFLHEWIESISVGFPNMYNFRIKHLYEILNKQHSAVPMWQYFNWFLHLKVLNLW